MLFRSISRSIVFDSATPWSIACQAPLSMEFSGQEYWSASPFLSPRDLPDPGIEPRSPSLQVDSLPSEPPGKSLSLILKIRELEVKFYPVPACSFQFSSVAQSCLTPCDPIDYSLPGASVHGILWARILEWVAFIFSRGSSQPRDQSQVSHIADGFLTN